MAPQKTLVTLTVRRGPVRGSLVMPVGVRGHPGRVVGPVGVSVGRAVRGPVHPVRARRPVHPRGRHARGRHSGAGPAGAHHAPPWRVVGRVLVLLGRGPRLARRLELKRTDPPLERTIRSWLTSGQKLRGSAALRGI